MGCKKGLIAVDILAADYVSCEAGRRTSSERETRKEVLCEIKWDYHIVGMMA